MGNTLSVDLSKATTFVSNFPNGVYPAKVASAKLDVSGAGNPMIVVELELYHPELGSGTIRDFLVPSFASKVKAFWQAVTGATNEEMQLPENQNVEIDPDELVGAELLVQLGEQENAEDGKTYKSLVGSWYFPASRSDLITFEYDG
jgi:hypothetical protein